MRAGFSPRKRFAQACTSYRVHTRTRASSASGAGKPSSSAICRGTRPARRAALAPDAAHNYAAVAPKGPLSALVTCSREGLPDVAPQPGVFALTSGQHPLPTRCRREGAGSTTGDSVPFPTQEAEESQGFLPPSTPGPSATGARSTPRTAFRTPVGVENAE
jgi:hypothetical protein